MLPIRDDNPQINIPYVTYGLIAINVFAWFLLQGYGMGPQLNASVCEYGLIPGEIFGGVGDGPNICQSFPSSGWFGLLSAMFMHGGWMHLIGNMWFLWVFGDNVEDAMGSTNFLLFYLLTGFAAAAAQIMADPSSDIPMVGASGAIGGVMGAYIMLYPKVKVHMLFIFVVFFKTFRIPAVAMLGYWIVIQLIGGFNSIGAKGGGVAFWAHIGGFVAGMVLVYLFKNDELLENHPHHGW